jgi:hypothetical protein
MIRTQMKIATIDIEGDGLRRELQQKIFENLGHFDRKTRPWCIGITTDQGTKMYVCKLPSRGRHIGDIEDKEYYGPKHDESTKIPSTIDGVEVRPFENRDNMILYIVSEILRLSAEGYEILFKGYKDHRLIEPDDYEDDFVLCELDEDFGYDLELIKTRIERIMSKVTSSMKLVYPKTWDNTHRQGYTGGKSNQVFLENGIRHCKEDCEQLYRLAIEGKTWRPK